jgi:hypothetical protein
LPQPSPPFADALFALAILILVVPLAVSSV